MDSANAWRLAESVEQAYVIDCHSCERAEIVRTVSDGAAAIVLGDLGWTVTETGTVLCDGCRL